MDKKVNLGKISRKIKNCKKCVLYKEAKNAVFGQGPVNSRIMFVGESPGREEDLSGLPFVGRSGKFLTKLIERAGLKREKVFITSVIKHRPPKNRKPKKEEARLCLPYLESQIEIINPKTIVLLGQTAFSAFFPKEKLKYFRGKTINKTGRRFFVTYHPAAGIRFQKIRTLLQRDFIRFRRNLVFR
ncbi:MAG: uracil-DNA glycosylase [Patescibacteria group bacterium]